MEDASRHTIILRLGSQSIGTGFLIDNTGLVVTCYHVVRAAFPSVDTYAGQRLSFSTLSLQESNGGSLVVTDAYDRDNDVVLLQIENAIPADLVAVRLIESKSALGLGFDLTGYAEIPDPNAHYPYYSTHGRIENIIPRSGVTVLKLKSDDLFPGMSGGAIFCPALNGVVGMQSARLNIDPRGGTWGEKTGFACTSESIQRLAGQTVKLHILHAQPLSLAEVVTGAINSPLSGAEFTALWKRPSESGSQRLLTNVVERKLILNELYERLGAARPYTQALVVWGMSGVGKSTLAAMYVTRYGSVEHYPGGVLWIDVGAQFDAERDIPNILERWSNALIGDLRYLPGFRQEQSPQLKMNDIRSIFGGHGEMLVILEDVWQYDQIAALLDHLPNEANVLITTREQATITRRDSRFATYEIRELSPADASTLLQMRLPQFPDDLLQKIAATFAYHAQSLDLVSSELRNRARPLEAAERLLQTRDQSSALAPILNAYTYSYHALPDDDMRRRVRLLALFAELALDFSDELASAVWNESLEMTSQALDLLYERALIRLNERGRWTVHAFLNDFVKSVATNEDERTAALNRYFRFVVASASVSEAWAIQQPSLEHFVYVGNKLVAEIEGVLGYSDFAHLPAQTSFSTEMVEDLTLFGTFLGSAFLYLIFRPEAYGIANRWITAYIAISSVLGETVATGWGWIILARWYLVGEQIDQALELLDHGVQFAQKHQELEIVCYALLAKGGTLNLIGQTKEAIEVFRFAYEQLGSADGDYPEIEANILIALSGLHLGINAFTQAEQYLEQAFDLLEHLPESPMSMLQVMRQLGVLNSSRNKEEEAIDLFERCREIASSLGDERVLAELDVHLGSAYLQLGDHANAEMHLERALKRAQAISYPRLIPPILTNQATIRFAVGDLSGTLSLLQSAVAQLVGYQDPNQEAQILALLGETYLRVGETDKALLHLKRAFPLMGRLQNAATSVTILNSIGSIYQQTNRISEGLDFFQQALPTIREINSAGAQVTILHWLSILCNQVGNARQALAYFEQAQSIVDRLDNLSEKAITFSLSGVIYRYMGEMEKAYTSMSKSADAWRKLNERMRLAELLVQLSDINRLRLDYKLAQEQLDEAVELIDASEDNRLLRAACASTQGALYLQMQQLSAATNLFEQSESLITDQPNSTLHISNLNALAFIDLLQGNIDVAKQRFGECLTLAKEQDFAPHIALVKTNLGWIAYLEGKLESAALQFEEAADLLEKEGIAADTANQSTEFMRTIAGSMRAQDSGATYSESINMLLQALNWETLSLIVQARAKYLLTETVESTLELHAIRLRAEGAVLPANAIKSFGTVISVVRRQGTPALQGLRANLETNHLERWWAYQHRSSANYGAALRVLNKLLERDRHDLEAKIERGWVLRGLGSITEAQRDFDEALQQQMGDYRPHQGLGVLYYERRMPDKALFHLGMAIKLNTRDAYNFQWRSAVYQSLGDHVAAQEDVEAAIQLQPANTSHHYWKGVLLIEMRQLSAAHVVFEQILQSDRTSSDLLEYDLFWDGVALELMGDLRMGQARWKAGMELIGSDSFRWSSALYSIVGERNEGTALERYALLLRRSYTWHSVIGQLRHILLLKRLYPSLPALDKIQLLLEDYAYGSGG